MDLTWTRQKQTSWDFTKEEGEKEEKKDKKLRESRRDPPPPIKGVKIQMCQMVEREPEKCDIRKAQGRRECIQYGLNHLGMQSKVHMLINPSRKFRTFFFFATWSVKMKSYHPCSSSSLSSLGNLNSFNLLLKALFSFSNNFHCSSQEPCQLFPHLA